MPYFENPSAVHIQDSTLTDVGGNFNQYNAHGNIHFSNDAESVVTRGINALLQKTAIGAFHNSYERFPPPKCHPETRKDVQSEITKWVDASGSEGKGIFWLSGPAGAGKSAIAQTVAELYDEYGILGGSFFFSRGNDQRGSAKYFVTTIAYELATAVPELYNRIGKVVGINRSILGQSLEVQLRKLLVEPFQSLAESSTPWQPVPPLLMIIDGLDECHGDTDHHAIVKHMSNLIHLHHLPLMFLITSRPEPHIRDAFLNDPMLLAMTSTLFLTSSYNDISAYLRSGFTELHTKHHNTMTDIPRPWPSPWVIDTLVQRSSGYFIYAATILKFIDDYDTWPPDQLNLVLKGSPTPFTELDRLYHQILSTVRNGALLVHVLECIVGSKQEFSAAVLAPLLGYKIGEIQVVLRKLHPLLDIPKDNEQHIRIIHVSFLDFLLSKERSNKFFVNSSRALADIAHGCLVHMKNWHMTSATTSRGLSSFTKYVAQNWAKNCIRVRDQHRLVSDLRAITHFSYPLTLDNFEVYEARPRCRSRNRPATAPQYNFQIWAMVEFNKGLSWLQTLPGSPLDIVDRMEAERDSIYSIGI